jgi:surfactin synthase thioesterase subunit
MTTTPVAQSRWLLNGVPAGGDFVVYGFPYAGVGASCFREWPRELGSGVFCAVQPPGRENRIREETIGSHQEFAEGLADALAEHTDRPYAFAGHCGAFPYMLQTVFELGRRGLPAPRRLFASSWGAPHRGLYGRLNFVDLDNVDMVAEIQEICVRLSRPVPPELAEMAAENMLVDLRVQRVYRYSGVPRVPVPVTLVGWSADDVVPPDVVWPSWDECADVTYHLLDGDHGAFLRGSAELFDLIRREMTGG